MKKKITFLLVLFLPLLSLAQTATLRGTVKDETGQVVSNKKVKIKNTSIETITDSIGSFELKNVPYGKNTLELLDDKGVTSSESIDVSEPNVLVNIISRGGFIDQGQGVNTDIPTISLGDDDMKESSTGTVSSVLTASRDVFSSAASFSFGVARFRIRGYDGQYAPTFMNGALLTDLANGRSEYYLWSGLNDVTRSRENSIGIQSTNFAFGNIGGVSSIDSRASHQRKQLQVSYASSNRVYDNRIVLTYGSGVNAKGWSYSVSYSRRWANEGYIPGTFYDGNSFFGSLEKKINLKNSLSLTAFAAKTKNGRATPVVKELHDLAGTNYYNPLWGYQNGKKRNASVGNTFQPLFILTHEWDISEKSSLLTAVSYEFGKYKVSGIDWYKAEDPRPDYYRYLPSFDPTYGEDPVTALRDSITLANYYTQNKDALQINWNKIYEANQIHEVAQYVISNRVTDSKRFGFNTVYNNSLNDNITLSGGINLQKQDLNYYKELDDLLGGNYFVNLNQFADLTTLVDSTVIQNDLNNPDAIIKEGDKYAYDYVAHLQKTSLWAQSVFKYSRFDFFLSAQVALTNFYRTGNMRNGVFKDESFGDSKKYNFTAPSFKGGVTYKYNGRNYFYVNGAYMQQAPYFDDVFISPRTRSRAIENVSNEKITSIEGGYLYTAPRLKARVTGFLTQFKDITDTRSFYYEELKTFVNYTQIGIEKRHAGIEIAVEATLGKGFSASAVASIGEYVYTDRPTTTVSQDNKDTLLASGDLVYSKNLHVAGGPQKAYSLGLNYRSKNYWYANISFNYFDDIYIDFNPVRRTIPNLEFVDAGTSQWNQILQQEKTDAQFTVDVSGGWSWKINDKFKALKRNSFIVFNLGITNILNNKDIVAFGYEQLRFDTRNRDISVYPSKYSYAFGTTYFASVIFRFN